MIKPTNLKTSLPAKLAVKKRDLPAHEPTLVRDVVEKVGGAFGAVSRVPGSFISGLAVGGYQGFRKGKDENFEVSPKSCSTGLVVCNAAQGLMVGAAGAFAVLGPLGAAASVAKDSVGAGVRTYMFVKGGSAGEMGRSMADSINQRVDGGAGALKGMGQGSWGGAVSAAKGAAHTGYLEGHAAASGLAEGCREVARHFKAAESTRDLGFLRRAGAMIAGSVSAVLAAPAAMAMAISSDSLENAVEPPSKLKRLAFSALSGGAVGAAAGALGGPLGAMLGAVGGAALALSGRSSKSEFALSVENSIEAAREDDTDLGHDIANRRRDLVQRTVTGLAAGAREGWNSGVGLFRAS